MVIMMEPNSFSVINADMVRGLLPARPADSHKGDFGHLLSVCGSVRMPGAAYLAASGAVRCGAGLVTAALPESAYAAIAPKLAEPLLLPLPGNENGTLSAAAFAEIEQGLENKTACLIGCGLGLNDDIKLITTRLVREIKIPLILDADGINAVAGNIDILRAAKADILLTPHPGEMARLLGVTVGDVRADRRGIAKKFAVTYGVTVILKGAGTVVASPGGCFVNPTGNAGMAKGGSGDLLAGMVSSFVAQGMKPPDAAVCGAYLHGLAGDRSAQELSVRGMTPSDMLERLPLLLSEFE